MTDRKNPSSDERHRRLGEALRENLRRRKQQARGRATGAETAAEPEGGENRPDPPRPRRDRPD
ncbi:MAG: hypothetical protein EPO23_07555 [Xanthobacteraceae bacterium]|nr:MAG: hypothetical protein EPO23_07555 [Xanthobacteraceae bacterium]